MALMIQKIFRSRFLLLFLIASGFAFYRFSYRKPPTDISLDKLPIQTLEGNTIDESSTKGKTLFLTFWATWCGDCRKEMPGLQKAIQELKNENIAFVLVSDEDPEKIKGFIKQFNYSPTSFYRLRESYRKQGIKSIPTNYIISPSGKVLLLESESGRDWSDPESIKLIKELIAKP
jgi:thiol-disulfide isomerase/thioredoxin